MSEIISQTIILSLLPVNDRFVSLIMGCLLGNQSDAMSGIGLIHHRPNITIMNMKFSMLLIFGFQSGPNIFPLTTDWTKLR